MKPKEVREEELLNKAQTFPPTKGSPELGAYFAENLRSVVRRYAAEPDSGATCVREAQTREVRLTTADRHHGFLEWLLVRCLGELSPPLQAPAFLGESERRLVLETADMIGREMLGPSPTVPSGRVVVRLVLDRCSGMPCSGQGHTPGASPMCSGPDGGPRRPGEIGHFCMGGPSSP